MVYSSSENKTIGQWTFQDFRTELIESTSSYSTNAVFIWRYPLILTSPPVYTLSASSGERDVVYVANKYVWHYASIEFMIKRFNNSEQQNFPYPWTWDQRFEGAVYITVLSY